VLIWRSAAGIAVTHPLNGPLARALQFSAFFCFTCIVCRSQAHDVVCSNGFGSFDAKSPGGVTVSVGAIKNAELAQRACQAKFTWGDQDLLVEPRASQVDVDVMGVDLGVGPQVVALQIKKSDLDSLMKYEIYSLTKPPRPLRTITGGDFFRAADTDLDGHIEIWTSDAGAVDGFESLPLSALDFAPPIVLRFEHKRLMDVSSEFQSQFDRQIATVRAQLDAQRLSDFKNSDGKLSIISHLTMDESHRLRITKIKVLEIVWCYLYSGREQDAWHALADMWPSADFDRIRAAILNARDHGIRSEVDGVSGGSSHSRRKRQVMIYDRVTDSQPNNQVHEEDETGGSEDHMRAFQADTYPQPILFRRPPPPEGLPAAVLTAEVAVNMVIDAAGKVWSIKIEGKPDKDLVDASSKWKFVPALKNGNPVASRLRLGVKPFQ
jgi:hypothetical protein